MGPFSDKTEVLIVGAGPVGLMMACQLANHGISFRIIDKKETVSTNSGALIIQARTLEIFGQMGIASEAIVEGIIADKINLISKGKKNAITSIGDIGGKLSPYPFLLMLEQSKTVKLLLKFINERGFNVERGVSFISMVREKDSVTTLVILPDGSEKQIFSQYVVAADGVRSSVRDFLKISFEGFTYPKPIFIMDCKAKTDIPPGEISFSFTNDLIAGFFPLQGSRWRIDGAFPCTNVAMESGTFKEIEKNFQSGLKVNFVPEDAEWFSVSRSQQKLANAFQTGNIFLAGDAAHVNTPVGAQGMNTGLQDAYNLAWKLAFVIRERAKSELLQTYTAERSGISRHFARYADAVFQVVTNENAGARFLRSSMMQTLLSHVFPWVGKRKIFRQMFFKSISQIAVNYRNSMLSEKASAGKFSSGAPRPGDRFPPIEFTYHGRMTNTFEMLNNNRFSLLVMAEALPLEFKSLATRYHLAVETILPVPDTKIVYRILGIKNTGFFLVRPDMYIAFRSATLDTSQLISYLKRFLVQPSDSQP